MELLSERVTAYLIDAPGAGFCSACLTGDYPVEISPAPGKEVLEVAIRA